MEQDNEKLIETLAEMISNNPQATALFNKLTDDTSETDKEDQKLQKAESEKPGGGFDLSTLLKIQEIMTSFTSAQNDDRSRLLQAIKPFLDEERRTQVDSAIKILSIASVFKAAGGFDLFKDFKF